MSIIKTMAAIPEIRSIEEDDLILILLKSHREDIRRISMKISRFQEEDPLMELVDIESEFAELLDKYKGKDRLNNPVLDIKMKELKRRSDKAKNKAKDYNVVTNSDADCNVKMYLSTLDRSIANREFSRNMRKRSGVNENTCVKLLEIIKNV